MTKYVKPTSLTWWSSVTPLVAGVIVLLADVYPALLPAKVVIDAVTGGAAGGLLINAGLGGIGLRAALVK